MTAPTPPSHPLNEEEMGKLLADFMKAQEPQIQASALTSTELCCAAAHAALASHAANARPAGDAAMSGDAAGPAAAPQLTAREKLIIGAVMYVCIHKMTASIAAFGLASGTFPGSVAGAP